MRAGTTPTRVWTLHALLELRTTQNQYALVRAHEAGERVRESVSVKEALGKRRPFVRSLWSRLGAEMSAQSRISSQMSAPGWLRNDE